MSSRRAAAFCVLLGGALVAGCHHAAKPVVNPSPSTSGSSGAGPGPREPAPPAMHAAAPDEAAVEARRRATLASLRQLIHFEYNVADLRPQDRALLDQKAAILRANPQLRIEITGNCDERGSDQYNIALGMRRAAAAKAYLGTAGVDTSRITTASLGREKPLETGSTEAAWAANRRDEFDIMAGGQNLVAPQ